jgi:two-component system sensor histidine kinase PilS (NtrC family)
MTTVDRSGFAGPRSTAEGRSGESIAGTAGTGARPDRTSTGVIARIVQPEAPGDSLVHAQAPAVDARPRLARLLLLRTLVVSVVLGLSLWLVAEGAAPSRAAVWSLSGIIAATYLSSIVFGVLLRRGFPSARVARPMLANDLALTSALVFVTGGAQSPYLFLYALTIITAGAVSYRRGAIAITIASLACMALVALLARAHVVDLPLPTGVQPWTQSVRDLTRTLGTHAVLMVGVGALAFAAGDQLQRGAETLATTRRAAAELLNLHRDIVRSLGSGLITSTPDGTVLSANEAAAEILGRPAEDLVGQASERALPGLAALLADRTPLRRAELTVPAPAANGRPARELVLGVTVSPLRDSRDQQIGRIINFQDLSDLRRLEQDARRAERLASLGQLAAGIAHEIRNPLASISGSLELLRNSPQASDDDRTLTAIVHREIARLDGLIGELLAYANPRPRQVVDFDLAVVIDEVAQMARGDQANAAVELAVDIARPLAMHADPSQLRQVIWNLVRNACEAAATRGGHVRVEATADARETTVSVTDDGAGIAPEHVARMFEPFFTTRAKGTGLGLATCHAIVAEHGGRIDVETEVGKGTKMTVTLPGNTEA